jgi:hypothetical protein
MTAAASSIFFMNRIFSLGIERRRGRLGSLPGTVPEGGEVTGDVARIRWLISALIVVVLCASPASAARPIVDYHKLDAYFALFASDSNVPWRPTAVRLDTYTNAPVDFSVYQVDPADVLTAGSNARPRAIDTRKMRPIAHFTFTPPGGYQFQSNHVDVPLGSRQGFFVVEARRGDVGEQVWINRTSVGLITKETPGEIMIYAADLGTGRALARMRVEFVVNGRFVTRYTDEHGILHWKTSPRPVFALAQWGASYAFASFLPQPPLPSAIVGVRTDTAVVHAGGGLRVVGFARVRRNDVFQAARGTATISMRRGAELVAQQSVPLDGAGAFATTLNVPANASSGDYAIIAQAAGGVGGASVHVDADANGLSIDAQSGCAGRCNPAEDVPVRITSSRGDVDVAVRVVRSPHVYVDYSPDGTPWATTQWLNTTVRTDANGHATVMIPHPTDGLASTYGVQATSGGASADTRIVVPTARATVRLRLDRTKQTLGTPIGFDVYANDVGNGKPLAGATVTAQLVHEPSVQQQRLKLDANGHAHGEFSHAELGTNLVFATIDDGGEKAMDAGEVDVVPQATGDVANADSANARVTLDKAVYHDGEEIHADAGLPGAQGDALITLESALGTESVVTPVRYGRARATFKARDALGDLRVGAAFVHDGAIEWTSVPIDVDAPGRPGWSPVTLGADDFAPGATANLALPRGADGPGTVVVRVSRGEPSGSALFETAPSLLAIGVAATQVSAPAGSTWHPWVDSTGAHAQVIEFERRGGPPPDLQLAQAATEAVSWSVVHADGSTIPVQLPAKSGRYTLSVLKISDDGRVVAASSAIVVR